jgi:KTSC domain
MPEWLKAESSMIREYRFVDQHTVDGVPFGTLEICWTNGSKGAYHDVNLRTYEEFAGAKSLGKFLNTVIKPNFRYERTQEPPDDEQEPQDEGGEEKAS